MNKPCVSLLRRSSRVSSRYVNAIDFGSEKEKKEYERDHPMGDPSTHHVVDPDSGNSKSEGSDYSVGDAQYSKGKKLVQVKSDGGFKSTAGFLAEALGGKWTHRERGYVMSPTQVKKFEKLYAEGWSAYAGELIRPGTHTFWDTHTAEFLKNKSKAVTDLAHGMRSEAKKAGFGSGGTKELREAFAHWYAGSPTTGSDHLTAMVGFLSSDKGNKILKSLETGVMKSLRKDGKKHFGYKDVGDAIDKFLNGDPDATI